VLQGAEKILASRQGPRALLLELEPQNLARFGCSAAAVVGFLGKLGYAPYVAERRSGMRKWDESILEIVPNVFFLRDFSP
jgi:hypothetical protein